MIEMLARRGANLEAAVSRAVPDGYGGEALPKGARALHAAVISKELEAVQALLDAGAHLESETEPEPRLTYSLFVPLLSMSSSICTKMNGYTYVFCILC